MDEPVSPLLRVANLTVRFGEFTAVNGISFQLAAGETVAVVGESGSGKSATALSLTRLLPPPPACDVSGEIWLDGRDLTKISYAEMYALRGKDIAYVFQEPATSLNPLLTVGYQIAEAIQLHRPDVTDIKNEIITGLDLVGIRDPEKRLKDYPHQLSGGMQQRVMIAMALVCRPAVLVADEPTTALDVTIQAQIVDLLRQLRKRMNMSILMITHNFGIVHGFADRVLVMFKGKIVEEGPTEQILRNPQHPYTRALIECVPRLGEKRERLVTIDYSKFA